MHVAFDRGARVVTHLFDAMCPFAHRGPGIVGAAMVRGEMTLGVIADPTRLSAEAIRLAFAAAPVRIALVADAVAAAGCPDGHFRLSEVEFEVTGGVARRADGTLVGGTLTLLDAVRHVHAMGVNLQPALGAPP